MNSKWLADLCFNLQRSSIVERMPIRHPPNSTLAYVNPDGPEAAATITELVDALEAARARLSKGETATVTVRETLAMLDDILAKVRSQQ